MAKRTTKKTIKKKSIESSSDKERASNPPRDPVELASWFAEAVRVEIAELEKQDSSRSHEVLSGVLVQSTSPDTAQYRFVLADGMRLPEEASGRLKTSSDEYAATVIGQQADRIELKVTSQTILPSNIPRGQLKIDDTALLRKLADVLESHAVNEQPAGALAAAVFHESAGSVGTSGLPDVPAFSRLMPDQKNAIEQACGSSITYVWGPPGTGKTFVIAHLVAALVYAGERVLVSSHTHAAVDQALYQAIEKGDAARGPLADHPAHHAGQILRIGETPSQRIPDTVRLDKVFEKKARGITDEIASLEIRAKLLRLDRLKLEETMAEWAKLAALLKRFRNAERYVAQTNNAFNEAEAEALSNEKWLEQCLRALEVAHRAWLWRAARVERATRAVEASQNALRESQHARETWRTAHEDAGQAMHRSKESHTEQQHHCAKLVPEIETTQQLAEIDEQIGEIEEPLRELHDQLKRLERKIIDEAKVVSCTLTKNYTGDSLSEQVFDAVIVDEISMALPPLVYLAANRASQRVVLVGDFLQLPPIVRSNTAVSNERLGTDVFELARIVCDGKPRRDCRVLVRLNGQQRMVTEIANVARHLVYDGAGGLRDHPKVKTREPLDWLGHFPSSPLVIVDTADLHCWSGKQPGSLSRFNFYTACLAVEIAASAAKKSPLPSADDRALIGIISPFAAQRRLQRRLLDDMGLSRWATAGTVHTFQGQEADLVIFDSVLDEPYWSARLCTPARREEVLRDLNVAVTRARHKFVFLGSSEWLNKHAKLTSGLGALWEYLKEHADLVPAAEFVTPELFENAGSLFDTPGGWTPPNSGDGISLRPLDEKSFFDCFSEDVRNARHSIFALIAYFGNYRWPKIEPLFRAALGRGVEITVVTPPPREARVPSYVEKAIENLRQAGAVVITATGIHGKDAIVDEKILYTGSMNFASSRGLFETAHRIVAPGYAKQYLKLMQAKHIREAALNADGSPRTCPLGHPAQLVNLRRQQNWDLNPLKIGCSDGECRDGYLVPIDQRSPFAERPRCQVDHKTKYRRVKRGRGERWQCPKHPKKCEGFKVVSGDPD